MGLFLHYPMQGLNSWKLDSRNQHFYPLGDVIHRKINEVLIEILSYCKYFVFDSEMPPIFFFFDLPEKL